MALTVSRPSSLCWSENRRAGCVEITLSRHRLAVVPLLVTMVVWNATIVVVLVVSGARALPLLALHVVVGLLLAYHALVGVTAATRITLWRDAVVVQSLGLGPRARVARADVCAFDVEQVRASWLPATLGMNAKTPWTLRLLRPHRDPEAVALAAIDLDALTFTAARLNALLAELRTPTAPRREPALAA